MGVRSKDPCRRIPSPYPPLPSLHQRYVYVLRSREGEVKVGVARDISLRTNQFTQHVEEIAFASPHPSGRAFLIEDMAQYLLRRAGHCASRTGRPVDWFMCDVPTAIEAVRRAEAALDALDSVAVIPPPPPSQ